MSGASHTAELPANARRRDLWIDAAWLVVLMIWSASYCLTASARTGVTYDEPFYMTAGMDGWHGWWAVMPTARGVMPLPISAATWPISVEEDITGTPIPVPLDHLHLARAVTLCWLFLLLVSALRLGRSAGGPWAGRLAAGLIAADPNFLAHSSLATTDIAISAALMGLTRAAYVGRSGGWWRRVTLPGLWFGLAALCKLSGLLYGGIILVVLEVAYRFSSGALSRPVGATVGTWAFRAIGATIRSLLAIAATIAIGIAIAVVSCGVSDSGTHPLDPLVNSLADNDPLKPKLQALSAEFGRMPYAVVAIVFQSWHNSHGRPSFLNGTYYPEGCWFFFPVLMAMKIPLPVLLLGLAVAFRPRAAFNPLTVAALLLTAVSLAANVQFGVRLVLPVIAIGYVAVAVAAVRGFGRCGGWTGLAAVAVMAATSVWMWPHGLGYLNQLAGGPSAAANRVSDSNLDWGQGIPDLKKWHLANGEPPIALWYFGTDPAATQPPFVPTAPEKEAIVTGDDFRRVVGARVLAVGTTVMTLHTDVTPAKTAALSYLRELQPLARTPTFVIYDFRDPVAPRVRK